MSDTYTLADVIKKDAKFSTFIQAVSDAGLTEKLREAGPFTVFAPSNAAFEKLSAETLSDLKKPENKAKFAGIINYHIILGKNMTGDVAKLKNVKTMQGQDLIVDATDGIKINGARLQARNFEASNGVVHSIDTVLAPAAVRS